jgi:hypothetical protein
MNQKLDRDHCLNLIEKQISVKIRSKASDYKDYDYCVKKFWKGIQASKFNFNDPKTAKTVIMRLSNDCKKMYYRPVARKD